MFPWRSHALWFLRQMARWDLIGDVDTEALAARVYRSDLYRAAVAPLGVSVPLADAKPEGAHRHLGTGRQPQPHRHGARQLL